MYTWIFGSHERLPGAPTTYLPAHPLPGAPVVRTVFLHQFALKYFSNLSACQRSYELIAFWKLGKGVSTFASRESYPVPSLPGTVTALFPGKGDILISELFGFLVELDGPHPHFQNQEVLSPDWYLDAAWYVFWQAAVWLSQYSDTCLATAHAQQTQLFLNISERVEKKEYNPLKFPVIITSLHL